MLVCIPLVGRNIVPWTTFVESLKIYACPNNWVGVAYGRNFTVAKEMDCIFSDANRCPRTRREFERDSLANIELFTSVRPSSLIPKVKQSSIWLYSTNGATKTANQESPVCTFPLHHSHGTIIFFALHVSRIMF